VPGIESWLVPETTIEAIFLPRARRISRRPSPGISAWPAGGLGGGQTMLAESFREPALQLQGISSVLQAC